MLKKRFEKTEILDEEFLEKLDEEIQKKYPYNTKINDNHNNINLNKDNKVEILEDTADLMYLSFIRDIEDLKEEKKSDDKLDDTVELLNTQINIIANKSNSLKDTIEFLNSDVSLLKQNNKTEILEDTADLMYLSFIRDIEDLKDEKKSDDKLDDTVELLNTQINIIANKSNSLEDTIEFLNSDVSLLKQNETIEILDEEIDSFDNPSKDLENTIELLDVEIRTEPIVVRKKITPKKRPWIILLSVCTLVIIFTVYKLFFWKHDSIKTNEQIESIISENKVSEIIINNNIAVGSVSTNKDYFNYLDVDFTNLLKENSDVKGWIKVNNTNINYPFVQTDNNDFYLKHSFDKGKNSAGWVFADFRNNFSYLDQNTILYAHGRLDNTMFGSLKKVVDKDWYQNNKNKFVQISTLDSKMIFEVFSVYTIKPEVYYITPNFDSDNEYNKFLNTLVNRSVYDFKVELDNKDKILTLSSCYNDDLRVVLHAKLVNMIQS